MGSNNACVSLWRDLRSPDTNLILRVGVTVALAALLGGLAILGSSAIAIGTDFRVDAEPIVIIGLTMSAVLWLVSLSLIWRRVRRGGAFVAPLVVTLGIGILTCLGLFIIDEVVHRIEGLVGTGLLLSAGALVIFVWMSTLHRLLRGKPVLGPDGQVDVRCPQCG
jgi:O-antigen/teichoic acid export membrane protein